MNKNILLPGGIGYIGSHVLLELLEKTEYYLTVIDNYYNSSQDVIERIFQAIVEDQFSAKKIEKMKSRLQFYQGDILNLIYLQKVFLEQLFQQRPITTIIHFAAKKSVYESNYFPLDYYENNFIGSLNLIKIMQKYPQCTQLIFSSTAAVYGEQDNCTQAFQCKPISPYGESKLCVEMMLKSVVKTHPQWKIISIRYFNPAGNHKSGKIGDNPGGVFPANLIPIIQDVIIGKKQSLTIFGNNLNTPDGSGVRDFIHVMDLADGHISALKYLDNMVDNNYQIFNLGTGHGYSVFQVISTFQNILKKNIKYTIGERRKGDLERLVAVPTKANNILQWKAKKTLNDMCQSVVKFTLWLKQKLIKQKQLMKIQNNHQASE